MGNSGKINLEYVSEDFAAEEEKLVVAPKEEKQVIEEVKVAEYIPEEKVVIVEEVIANPIPKLVKIDTRRMPLVKFTFD